MKHLKKYMVLFLCSMLITGCGNKDSSKGKDIGATSSVDQVLSNQITDENWKTDTKENEKAPVNDQVDEDTRDTQGTEGTVDYDLTQMGSDMVYATVYQVMTAPEEYEGKTFRMDGTFLAYYYEAEKKYYFYCFIQDAAGCCSNGVEFVWEDGSHRYPDEYPEENAEIVVEGTLETYQEEGDPNLYCRLSDATLQQKN